MKANKHSKRFSLVRFLLVISLKNIFKAECARQYIFGDTDVAKDIEEFEKWRVKEHNSRLGVKTYSDRPIDAQAPQSAQ